jgi:opacity protein-like surface antigen
MKRSLLLSTAALGMAVLPTVAAAQDWTGWYIGKHAGYLSGTVDFEGATLLADSDISGFIGGGLVGHGFALNPGQPWVFGIEADFGIGNVGGASGNDGGDEIVDAVLIVTSADLEWNAHFRKYLGVGLGDNAMVFAAGGLALAGLRIDSNYFSNPIDQVFVGATIGGGVNFRLTPNMFGRVEGLYDHYPTRTIPHEWSEYEIGVSTWTARAALVFELP